MSQDANKELMEAAKSGNLDEVRRLVDAGADVNFPAEHGLRPLLLSTLELWRNKISVAKSYPALDRD